MYGRSVTGARQILYFLPSIFFLLCWGLDLAGIIHIDSDPACWQSKVEFLDKLSCLID